MQDKYNLIKLNKVKKNSLFFIFIVTTSLFFICFFCEDTLAISCTPPAPSGPTEGFIDVEYEYSMNTYEEGSSWMFDWGDGTYSNWIDVSEFNNSVTARYSWSKPGEYSVRIRFQNKYLEKSSWSLPLNVKIALPVDTDNDGLYDYEDDDIDGDTVINENDFFPENVDEWVDTDNDGIGNNADSDDDGDGLSDVIENQLSSNSLDGTDVLSITIKSKKHYLVDTDRDEIYNKFYNTATAKSTSLKLENSNTYLIDIDDDGITDYSYNNGVLSKYEPFFSTNLIYLIIGIILAVIIVIFVLFKTGIFYIYEEEYEIEK